MIAKRRVFFSVVIGLLVEAINKISPLLILHFAQARLGLESFGYAQFGMTLVDLALPFIVFGYNTIGAIEIGRCKDDLKKVGELVSNIAVLKIAHAAAIFVVLISLTRLIPEYRQYTSLVLALSFILFFGALELYHVHVGMQRMAIFGLFVGIAKVVSLILIFSFVDDPSDAIWYAVFSMGASALVNFCSLLYGMRFIPFAKPNLAGMRAIFAKGLPFALVIIMFNFSEKFDMFLANGFFGNVGAGLYAGPSRIAQSLFSAVWAISVVFFSELVALHDKEAFSKNFNVGVWVVFAFLLPIVVGVWFVDQQLIDLILGPNFAEQGRILSTLVLALASHVLITSFGFQVLMLRQKQKTMVVLLSATAIIGCLIAWPLSRYYQLQGIALSVLISKSLCAAILIVAAKPFLTRLPLLEFGRSLLPALLMGLVIFMANLQNIWQIIAVGVVSYGCLATLCNWPLVKRFYALATKPRIRTTP